jgi:hypothetical protein
MPRLRWGRVIGCLLGLAAVGLLLWSMQFWSPAVGHWMHRNLFLTLFLAGILGYVLGHIQGEKEHRDRCRFFKDCYDPSHQVQNRPSNS